MSGVRRDGSRRLRTARACVSIAAIAVVALGCRGPQIQTAGVFIMGVDGMDYSLTTRLMQEGRMPELSRLESDGQFQALRTSIPPQSPVAWSDFTVGHDAGVHGIFDFIHRDAATLTPYLSTSRAVAAKPMLRLGRWQAPWGGRVDGLRQGPPFWAALTRRGIETVIIRMPGNFPPSGEADVELSGMGTPDLLGTYGTYTLHNSRVDINAVPLEGGRRLPLTLADGVASGTLPGPPNPFLADGSPVQVRFALEVDPDRPAAVITLGDARQILRVGEWSNWMPIAFPLVPTQYLHGMVRFHLQAVHPDVVLYGSPINIDPSAPAMPISTPPSFAADLSRTIGRFYTQGIVEETKALSDGVFSRAEFLSQVAVARDEALGQFRAVRGRFSGGLFFYHFGFIDQVSHMLWRTLDPEHPAYNAARDAPFAHEIERLYEEMDRLVGETRRALPADTLLIVMSDHGFTSWRRTLHLNTWLREHGYLAVRSHDPGPPGGGGLEDIDWTRTRAYGLGLNGLYVNQRGREQHGIVPDGDVEALLEKLRRELLATTDPGTGRPAVTAVFGRGDFEQGPAAAGGPDLIVGYARGVRCSNESAVGGVPDRPVFEDNVGEWSGDHCMDPDAVPGVLFASRPLRQQVSRLKDLPGAILDVFNARPASGR